MALISFSTYRESSPSTRNKAAAAKGLAPMASADVFGHATPPPDIAEKLLKKLKEKPKKKKKEDDTVSEGKGQSPNYSFDNFIKKAATTSKEVEGELEKGKKDLDKLEKLKQKKKEDKKDPFPEKMIQKSPFPKNTDNEDFKDKEEVPGKELSSDDDDKEEKEND